MINLIWNQNKNLSLMKITTKNIYKKNLAKFKMTSM